MLLDKMTPGPAVVGNYRQRQIAMECHYVLPCGGTVSAWDPCFRVEPKQAAGGGGLTSSHENSGCLVERNFSSGLSAAEGE
jgi:hypothetical protein